MPVLDNNQETLKMAVFQVSLGLSSYPAVFFEHTFWQNF